MRIKIGYLRNIWANTGSLVDATVRSEGSILLSGGTGSGKTTLLWYLLFNLIRSMGDSLELEICDYKYEFQSLCGCPRYHYEVEDIIDAIDRFYKSFQKARGNPDTHIQHCLVIEEYYSFISFLESMAKTNKEYKETYQRISMEIRSILAMGRSIGFSLICVMQQASASAFSVTRRFLITGDDAFTAN